MNEMNESIDDFEFELKCKFYKYDDNDGHHTVANNNVDNEQNDVDESEHEEIVNCNDFDQPDQDDYGRTTNQNAKTTYTKRTDLSVKRRCRTTMNSSNNNSMLNNNSLSSDNSSIFNVSNYAVSLLTEDVCFT